MANNKEGQQGSMNRLKMVKKGGQEEETLEGEGGTLFTFLKQKVRKGEREEESLFIYILRALTHLMLVFVLFISTVGTES